MNTEEESTQWKTGYTVALVLAVTYIISLGLFTWIFNYTL